MFMDDHLCRGAKPRTAQPRDTDQKSTTKVVDLTASESVIRANWGKPIVVGREFRKIRESGEIVNWGRYCKDTWGTTKQAVNYLIGQAKVADNLGLPDDYPSTRLRPLIGLTAALQAEAWKSAVGMTKHSCPTAAHIKTSVAKLRNKPVAPWSLRNACAILDKALKCGIHRAISGATDQEVEKFHAELPLRLEHYQELFHGPEAEEKSCTTIPNPGISRRPVFPYIVGVASMSNLQATILALDQYPADPEAQEMQKQLNELIDAINALTAVADQA
jgi:hypothetical protein